MKGLFSQRYGYVKPSDIIITEKMTPEIVNSLCTCYDNLKDNLYSHPTAMKYVDLQKYLWVYFLHQRKSDYLYAQNKNVAVTFIEGNSKWYEKLDMIEVTIRFVLSINDKPRDNILKSILYRFINDINYFFEDLNFGYRIVEYKVVPVTSKVEIKAIEEAVVEAADNVRMHLQSALEKIAERPKGDYRNSIKESISAVEAYCRNKTGKDTLGSALSDLEKKGLHLAPSIKSAFNILYGYTNSSDTGIRHPLMDASGEYVPTADEAVYMLVICSAFINYLRKKEK